MITDSSHDATSTRSSEWFAIRVKSNCERVVAASLEGKGFEVCVPVCRPARYARSRNKERALFPGYIFSCFDRAYVLPIVVVPGVVNIVGRGPIPEPLDPTEMLAVRKLANSGLASEPCPWLRVGQRVRVWEGPLEGVEGILVRERGEDRLVISVSLLLRSVIAEVDRMSVEPLAEAA